jgi:hypothetical protein
VLISVTKRSFSPKRQEKVLELMEKIQKKETKEQVFDKGKQI